VWDQQRGRPWLAHPDADAVTRDPRLADLQQGRTNAVTVTDADLVIRKSRDREVLAELPVSEIVAADELLPVAEDSIWQTNTARLTPPCPCRSPWPAPSTLSAMWSRRSSR
jgi:hypothetical protein